MGALTLKSFPFELRGWDIEKFESVDPTDSFGCNTQVYINKNQIVLIEPDYDSSNSNTWITDKGRQFFDGIFNSWNKKKQTKNNWNNIINTIIQTIYVIDHCNKQKYKKKFFTIVFENLSLEVLNMLIILSQNYSFIKLRRTENYNIKNDSELFFQLNTAAKKTKLNNVTLCLLIGSNPRYEGYYLNLNLRQRYLKGNFKCYSLGSIINLTFPVSFIGSNIKILKSIAEGNSLICQDLKSAKKPLIIYNNELFRRKDSNTVLKMFKTLNYSNNYNKHFTGLNMLSSSLSENGNQLLSKFAMLNNKDFNESYVLYFINVSENNIKNLKKITEFNLLNYSITKNDNSNNIFIDQNYKINNSLAFFKKAKFSSYKYVPTNTFYENEETFINTEGFVKRTTKLISKNKNKSNWQILRKFLKEFKNNYKSLINLSNELIYFNSQKKSNFKNFTYFNYYATQNLNNLNFYLTIKTKPISFYNNFKNFKNSPTKFRNTKIKYWLNDFFIDGKDEYSQNSFILTDCSKVLRSDVTNFS